MRKGKYFWKCFVPLCNNSSHNTPDKLCVSVPRTLERNKWFAAVNKTLTCGLNTPVFCCVDNFKEEEIKRTSDDRIKIRKEVYPRPLADPSTKLPSCDNTVPEGSSSSSKVISSTSSQSAQSVQTVKEKRMTSVGTQTDLEFCSVGTQTDDLPESAILKPNLHCKQQDQKTGTQTDDLQESAILKPNLHCKQLDQKTEQAWKEPIYAVPKEFYAIAKRPRKDFLETSFSTNSNSNSQPSQQNSGTGLSQEFEDSKEKKSLREMNTKLMLDNPRYYLGLSEESLCLVSHLAEHSECQELEILICLRKIRLNEASIGIALALGLSNSYVCKVIRTIIPIIASFLKTFIFWPDKKIILANLPLSFRSHYSRVASTIDCFEIQIEKLLDALSQALTWSTYKKCNTVKYLVAISPDGFITFISVGFGGRTTDLEIVKESGYLDVLPPNVSVLADRGFKGIEKLLHDKQCTLLRPPSLGKGKQLSQEEAMTTKVIASLRIHVERVIRRIREYTLLSAHSCFHHDLLKLIDAAVVTACALSNCQTSIIL